MRLPKFRVYKARDGWRWRLVAANGRIVATGESHPRKAGAERAAARLAAVAELASARQPEVAGADKAVNSTLAVSVDRLTQQQRLVAAAAGMAREMKLALARLP